MSVERSQKPVLAVVGPTASGKSTLAINLALQLGGEIINCDSVQVYQGIQIATAKVLHSERRGVAHHLIDFVPPEVNYTAGDWAREAAKKIDEIEQRGKRRFWQRNGLLRACAGVFSSPRDPGLRRRSLNSERYAARNTYTALAKARSRVRTRTVPARLAASSSRT